MLLGTSKGVRFGEDSVEFHFVARSQKEKKEAFRAARRESGSEIDAEADVLFDVRVDAVLWIFGLSCDLARTASSSLSERVYREWVDRGARLTSW